MIDEDERNLSGMKADEFEQRSRDRNLELLAVGQALEKACDLIVAIAGSAIEGKLRALVDEFEDQYLNWPSVRLFDRLRAYAFAGVALPKTLPEDSGTAPDAPVAAARKADPKALVAEAAAFVETLPVRQWKLDADDALRTLAAAEARRSLEAGLSVHPEGLAALGGLSPRTLRNMMAKKTGAMKSWRGRIGYEDAVKWLADREEFQPSTWRGRNVAPERPRRRWQPADTVPLPVSRNKVRFDERCAVDGVFDIGCGAQRQKVAGFFEALDILQNMDPPVWRHRDLEGRWETFVGRETVPVPASDLPKDE